MQTKRTNTLNWRDELPTLALLLGTYAGFGALALSAGTLPLWAIIPGLIPVIALHSSLQHEVLHGHPFANGWLSDATVFPALGLFIPYLRFKDTHLAHHYDPNLTDPYDDPETNFLCPARWAAMPRWQRALAQVNNTLAGRMSIGPAIALAVFYAADARALGRGDRRVILSYLHHAGGVALVLGFVLGLTALPLWALALACYGAMSVLKIRTFLEHRAHDRAAARSVIIEDRGPLALLFLNNNYHAVHHAHPRVVWHQLPARFAARRDLFLKRNGGYAYSSYWAVFRAHFLRAKDPVAHPLWPAPERPGAFGQNRTPAE